MAGRCLSFWVWSLSYQGRLCQAGATHARPGASHTRPVLLFPLMPRPDLPQQGASFVPGLTSHTTASRTSPRPLNEAGLSHQPAASHAGPRPPTPRPHTPKACSTRPITLGLGLHIVGPGLVCQGHSLSYQGGFHTRAFSNQARSISYQTRPPLRGHTRRTKPGAASHTNQASHQARARCFAYEARGLAVSEHPRGTSFWVLSFEVRVLARPSLPYQGGPLVPGRCLPFSVLSL